MHHQLILHHHLQSRSSSSLSHHDAPLELNGGSSRSRCPSRHSSLELAPSSLLPAKPHARPGRVHCDTDRRRQSGMAHVHIVWACTYISCVLRKCTRPSLTASLRAPQDQQTSDDADDPEVHGIRARPDADAPSRFERRSCHQHHHASALSVVSSSRSRHRPSAIIYFAQWYCST